MSLSVPSRRGLLTATAWSVPVVVLASSAPAFAASRAICGPVSYQLSWSASGYTFTPAKASAPSGPGTGVALATPVGPVPPPLRADQKPLTVTVTNALNGGRVRGATANATGGTYQNMRVSPGNIGGLAQRGLTVLQDFTSNTELPTPHAAHGQTVTLQFSRPVKSLSFSITDVDSTSGQYRDRVWASPAPASASLASSLVGSGTSQSPWRTSSTNAGYDPNSASGNAALTFRDDSAISVVQVHFYNDQDKGLSANGLQGIFLSNLRFTADTC